MEPVSPVLVMWQRLSGTAAGRWLFSRLVCWRAPYFATIRPRFTRLEHGRCELRMPKRRAVLNHIGTVHAIAMCNMAELAAGTVTEVTIPGSHRWIPKGMNVDYLHKASTHLRARAVLQMPTQLGPAVELPVQVAVEDEAGLVVLNATIRMWVSMKRP
jgi:acyl-coenzyme A thioesterase PaaI-like protein